MSDQDYISTERFLSNKKDDVAALFKDNCCEELRKKRKSYIFLKIIFTVLFYMSKF